MKQMKIKQISVNNMLSVQKPVSRKNSHYPISNLFLLCCYILLKPKRDVRKKFEYFVIGSRPP